MPPAPIRPDDTHEIESKQFRKHPPNPIRQIALETTEVIGSSVDPAVEKRLGQRVAPREVPDKVANGVGDRTAIAPVDVTAQEPLAALAVGIRAVDEPVAIVVVAIGTVPRVSLDARQHSSVEERARQLRVPIDRDVERQRR